METKTTFWNTSKRLNKCPLIIAGPCSAETEDQVIKTAKLLAKTEVVHIIRAGIWKPRTHPGSFEGVGTKGLPWLQQANRITGLPVATEVANTKQVEDALHFEVDVLWIGARSTVNPVSVQEMANALRGTNIPVLIKNPMNPDIELWIGAVERISQAGIKNIGLIHRGFSTFGDLEYRNTPMWHLAIEMRRLNPELKMICDPTHISGRRDIIKKVVQKAVDLNYDGLMIESHIDPDNAWSDARQQLTPCAFKKIMNDIVWWKGNSCKEQLNIMLEELREQINLIDDELLQLISRRMKVAEKIGGYKKDNEITILQKARWKEVLDRGRRAGSILGLSPEFIKKYLSALHMESINHQNKLMNS